MRVVVDTDTVVAALFLEGAPAKLASLWKAGRIKPYASSEIIEEYLLTLACPEFNLLEKEIEYLLYQEILPCFEIALVEPLRIEESNTLSSNKFVRCARAAGAAPIISGDRRLLSRKACGPIQFISPACFLKTVNFPIAENTL